MPLFAKKNAKVDAYGVGQIDLPEGPRVQAILVGGPDDFEIGMELELDLEVLGPDEDGNDVVIFRFRPWRRDPRICARRRPSREGAQIVVRLEGVAVAGSGWCGSAGTRTAAGADLAREAGLAALHDAGITLADVDEAFVGYIQPKSMLGVKAMKELGLTGLPVTHVENASATGLVAFREAAWAVASGRAEVAMAIGFDKMTEMGEPGGPSRGTGRDQLDATILPAAYFALWAQRRMHDHGTTPRDLRRHRRQELEPRRALPVERPAARPRRHRRGGAGVADGVRAAHRDDGVPGRRRRRLRDRRVHRVGASGTSPTAAWSVRSRRPSAARPTRPATPSSDRSSARRR